MLVSPLLNKFSDACPVFARAEITNLMLNFVDSLEKRMPIAIRYQRKIVSHSLLSTQLGTIISLDFDV